MIDAARQFILANGRLLERHRFAALFDGAPADPVIRALGAYWAPAGFGHGLEPDKRTPTPQPIDQEEALKIMDEHGSDAFVPDIVAALPGLSNEDGALPFTTPSTVGAPHAPWWGTDDAQPSSLNPTAGICGLLHRLGAGSAWVDRATVFCWDRIAAGPRDEMHELAAVLGFLAHVPDRARAGAALDALRDQVRRNTVFDAGLETYGYGPLDYAQAPDAPARAYYSDAEIAAHLDALTAGQQADGGWTFPWPETSPGAAQEWRGIVTLRAVKTLRAYGRV